MRHIETRNLTTNVLTMAAILAISAISTKAKTPSAVPDPEGSWLYTVTIPVPSSSPLVFQGLETYGASGGYSEADQLSFMPGSIATPGHGAWKTTAPGAFLLTFQQLTFDNSGNPTGISKILQTTTLDPSGNSYRGSGTFAYYDLNGKLIAGSNGTFTITATRIVVQAVNTTATAAPANATVTTREIQLDGRGSTSSDGKALKYFWTMAPGSPSAAITAYDTPTPTVQFPARGNYSFLLTVTDSTGGTATSVATVNFADY
jgi:PKD domain